MGEGKGQRLSVAVHIIDALFLGGVDVRGQGYVERMEKARLMTRSLLKLTYRDLTPVRTKELYQLKAVDRVLQQRLVEKQIKGVKMCVCVCVCVCACVSCECARACMFTSSPVYPCVCV